MSAMAVDEEQPVIDDARSMENVREALGNGYDRLCARCGIGTAGDDMDIHEPACPEFKRDDCPPMTAADLLRAAHSVIPPAGASVMATVDHTPGHRLPTGAAADIGGLTVYRAAWLVDGIERSAPFGPAFERPRDLPRFIGLLTGRTA